MGVHVKNKSGFTLVELLLVIAIIAVITTAAVEVFRQAQEDSRASATEALINKIDNLLEQRKLHYSVRRIPVDLTAYTDEPGTFITLRQMIVLDVVNVEMPRDAGDVIDFNTPTDFSYHGIS